MHAAWLRILAPPVWPVRTLRCMPSGWLKPLSSERITWTCVSPAKLCRSARRRSGRAESGGWWIAYGGVDDIRAQCPDLPEDQVAITDFGDHPEERYNDDMFRLTRYRTDPDL